MERSRKVFLSHFPRVVKNNTVRSYYENLLLVFNDSFEFVERDNLKPLNEDKFVSISRFTSRKSKY